MNLKKVEYPCRPNFAMNSSTINSSILIGPEVKIPFNFQLRGIQSEKLTEVKEVDYIIDKINQLITETREGYSFLLCFEDSSYPTLYYIEKDGDKVSLNDTINMWIENVIG